MARGIDPTSTITWVILISHCQATAACKHGNCTTAAAAARGHLEASASCDACAGDPVPIQQL